MGNKFTLCRPTTDQTDPRANIRPDAGGNRRQDASEFNVDGSSHSGSSRSVSFSESGWLPTGSPVRSRSRSVDSDASDISSTSSHNTGESVGTQSTASSNSKVIFNGQEVGQLRAAEKVLVHEYSSTGGGHTERSLQPIVNAFNNGGLKKGDAVVVLAPPRWESDRAGNQVNKLHTYVNQLRDLGLHVMVKQSDKTITGLYEHAGPSDNVAMLRDLVYKPRRDTRRVDQSVERPNPLTQVDVGRSYSANKVLNDVLNAVGAENIGKISVSGDMAPYLQKAAKARGIANRVEIGNHQGLFVGAGRESLEGKDLSYLAKASSANLPSRLSLVSYDAKMNVLPTLAATTDALGIRASDTQEAAYKTVVAHMHAHANRTSLVEGDPATPGILLKDGVPPESVRAAVYLYLNEYTKPMVDHLRERINSGAHGYDQAMFVICGNGTMKTGEQGNPIPQAPNALHGAIGGVFDGATAGGFGTTSEYVQNYRAGSTARFIVAPVEHQHEQAANAAEMVAQCGDAVTQAIGIDQMTQSMDKLVQLRVSQSPQDRFGGRTMEGILASANRRVNSDGSAVSYAENAAQLLANPNVPMRADAAEAVKAMAEYDATHAPKEHRRFNKLLVPALDAMIIKDPSRDRDFVKFFGHDGAVTDDLSFAVRATKKVQETPTNVAQVVKLMRSAAAIGVEGDAALKGLLQIDIKNVKVKALLSEYADTLERLSQIQDPVSRSEAAREVLTDLARNKIALGW